MERRQFIKNSALGSAASAFMPAGFFFRTTAEGKQEIHWKGTELPLAFDIDILINGGSFAGLSYAVNMVRKGKKVVIIDPKTFLGDEITAWLNYNINLESFPYPEPLEICRKCSEPANGQRFVRSGDLKTELEIMLEKYDIPLLYNTYPIRIIRDGLKYSVITGNKSGFRLIRAKTIIDCSPESVVKCLSGDLRHVQLGENTSITAEMNKTGEFRGDTVIVPDELRVTDNRISCVPGWREGHLFITFSCSTGKNVEADIFTLNKRETGIRLKAFEVVKYLVNNVPQFRDASYMRLSHYVRHDFIFLREKTPEWAETLFDEEIACHGGANRASSYAGKYPDIWLLPPQKFGYSAVMAGCAGDRLAEITAGKDVPANSFSERKTADSADGSIVCHDDRRHEGKYLQGLYADSFGIPVLGNYDMIVAGGGTSGATAGITAGEEGLKTLVVEGNAGLGGTGTFGGVIDYYNGRKAGFNLVTEKQVLLAEKEIRHNREPHPHRWNAEVKNHVLTRRAKLAGNDLIFRSFVVGSLVEGQRVKGVVLATPLGIFAATAGFVVDATGDGDVAAFAGSDYSYGSAFNVFPLYSSLAAVDLSGNFRTKFNFPADMRNCDDLTRSVIANRRMDQGSKPYDHAFYFTPRESRHIKGDVTISLTDLLTFSQWDDTVNIHLSNVDITGHHSSDWLRIGLLPPNIAVEIPLRALTPAGLENILVTGKAFSAKHDVFPALRMQRDLENLGGVAALICSHAIKTKRKIREIDLKNLQYDLIKRNILPGEIASRKLTIPKYEPEDIPALISRLDGDKQLQMYSDVNPKSICTERLPFVELCLLNHKAVPSLEQALASCTGNKKILIAKALAFIGSRSAVEVIVDQISENIKNGVLPERTEKISHAAPGIMLPNQAAMPETAYLLNALAMCRDKRSIPVWKKMVEILNSTELDLTNTVKAIFYYVDAICYGAELLGDTEVIPILADLHRNPMFNGQYSPVTPGIESQSERKAMLELEIASALARSGSKEGFKILVEYLDDNRAIMAQFAHNALKSIQNEDFGKNKALWQQWLNTVGKQWDPSPLRYRMDG